MKAFPIARKLAALWIELRPPRLAVDRIQFLRVPAAIMIEYQIGVHLQPERVSRLNQVE